MVTRVKDESYTISLTEDEIYTLQILLGFVACDKECSKISEKLEEATGECAELEDYERVSFSVENMDTGKVSRVIPITPEAESVVIRFN